MVCGQTKRNYISKIDKGFDGFARFIFAFTHNICSGDWIWNNGKPCIARYNVVFGIVFYYPLRYRSRRKRLSYLDSFLYTNTLDCVFVLLSLHNSKNRWFYLSDIIISGHRVCYRPQFVMLFSVIPLRFIPAFVADYRV